MLLHRFGLHTIDSQVMEFAEACLETPYGVCAKLPQKAERYMSQFDSILAAVVDVNLTQ